MTRKVLNDCGDVPRWYWQASAFLPPPRPRRRNWKALGVIALLLAVAGCSGCHPSPAPVVIPTGAAGAAPAPTPAPDGPVTCLDFCRHGDALKCPWADATPAGATCVQVCVNNQKVAIAPWDLDCRVAAAVCDPPKCQ